MAGSIASAGACGWYDQRSATSVLTWVVTHEPQHPLTLGGTNDPITIDVISL
jgi:hypothetical protein